MCVRERESARARLNNLLYEYFEFGHVYNVLVKPYEPRVENEVKLLLRCRRGRYGLVFSLALTTNQQKYSRPRTFESVTYQLKNMAEKMKNSDDCSFKTYICESVADDSSSEEKSGDNDAPAVFMCGKCKLPIGDSLSWAGSDEELNQILLKRKRLLRYVTCLGCVRWMCLRMSVRFFFKMKLIRF